MLQRGICCDATRKTPHRAPPCEELDPPCDIKLVFVQQITFVPRKINKKTAATGAALFDPSMHQIVCRLGLHPRPHWRACSAPPAPIAVFRGPAATRRGGEEEERKGMEFIIIIIDIFKVA